MEGAADAAILQPPVAQIRAAMGAVPADQAITAVPVAECHQPLPQKGYGADWPVAFEFVDQRDGLPIAAQHRTGLRSRTRAGERLVQVIGHHVMLSSIPQNAANQLRSVSP